MDVRRLETLVLLSRLGSMRAVADELRTTTSTVSQQIATLAREVGAPLIEPEGRRVRLTPAGQRLARHAVTILAAVDAARLDLDPAAEPAGTVRVAGFASAVRRALLPVTVHLSAEHPNVRLLIHEHEPAEVTALLSSDEIDLGLVYEYNLAPAATDPALEYRPLWTTAWSLGVPAASASARAGASAKAGATAKAGAAAVFGRFRDDDWIVNSRSAADEVAVRTIASMAGFEPRIAHHADSLELVQDLIVAGLGVGLLPGDQPTRAGVRLIPLRDPDLALRAYAVVRRGRASWPPLALILDLLTSSL
jgi:DNA-binding transcriptional LysR family regulator